MRSSILRLALLVPAVSGCGGIPSRIALPAPLSGTAPLTVRGRMDDGQHITFGPFTARLQSDDAIQKSGRVLMRGARGDLEREWTLAVQRDGIPIASAACRSGPRTDFSCTLLLPGGDTLGTLEGRDRAPEDSAMLWDGRPPEMVGGIELEDRHLLLMGRAALRGMPCLAPSVCAWLLIGADDRVLAAIEANAGGWVYPADDLTEGEYDLVGIVGSILLLRPDVGAEAARAEGR